MYKNLFLGSIDMEKLILELKTHTAKKIYGELKFFSSINKIFVDVEAQF